MAFFQVLLFFPLDKDIKKETDLPNPASIYLFKVNNRTTKKKSVKYGQRCTNPDVNMQISACEYVNADINIFVFTKK